MAKCLYNGKIYPAPPAAWDKSKYPIAYISISLGRAYFKVFDRLGFLQLNDIGYYIYTLGSVITDENPQYINACSWWLSDDGLEWEVSGTDESKFAHAADRGPIWSNETICYEDGTVAIEGSEPIVLTAPENDPVSYQIGMGLGMSLIGRRLVQKPFMCLYGEVEKLPPAPKWDKKTFPYAAVFKYADCDYKDAEYKFVAVTAPYYYGFSWNTIVTATQVRRRFWLSDDGTEWIDKGEVEQEVSGYLSILELYDGHSVVWANHDILWLNKPDVYLKASSIIPVAE